jgi:predicted Zn-dependent peptidase
MLLREENGLTYSSYAYTDFFEHMGDFKIYAECDNSKVFYNGSVTQGAKGIKGIKAPGVFPLLIGLIEDLVKNGIKQDELTMAKSYLKNKMRMKSEDCDALAKHNGKLALFGLEHIPFSDVYKKCIEPITKKEMDACIKKYFRQDRTNLSEIYDR